MVHVVMDETNSYQVTLGIPLTIAVPHGDNEYLESLSDEDKITVFTKMVTDHVQHITAFHASQHEEFWRDKVQEKPIHAKISFGGPGVFELDYEEV